ncbi:MAG: metal-dependent transcriptional regulator [Anaerolineae bacterium]
MQTESTEMYLITVYRLTRKAAHASTKEIAEMLGVSPPSVSERVKRLAERGYLVHAWREGAALTEEGRRIAINILRKHRLIETFLAETAGYAIDEIHDEACQIEHAMSDRLADRLEAMLGYPEVDPHGHPIPRKDGSVAELDFQSLADVSPGVTVTIRQVSDWDQAQLQYLRKLGLVPGIEILVQDAAPFQGPLTLQLDTQTIAIARSIAEDIGVTLHE